VSILGDGLEPASFRDPTARVFYDQGRVLRGLDESSAADWDALAQTNFFAEALTRGTIIGTREVDTDTVSALGFARVLEHDRIPVISYPYEWSFDMLRDAAVLQLELQIAALREGMSVKDASPFNVQWRGTSPVFIDISSFERSSGGPWVGYRQFCQMFLFPLMLEAHLGVPFQRHLVGNLDGIDPNEMSAFFTGRRRFAKGVFRHVYLHSLATRRVKQPSEKVRSDLRESGLNAELAHAAMRKVLRLIQALRSKRADSGWNSYRQTCSYTDDDRDAKERFIRSAMGDRRVGLTYDLGANDGAYARIAASFSDQVVAVDADDVTVNAMFRSLRADKIDNVLPLVMNLVDPSPARGWRNLERRSFHERAEPDLVFALALVHHLAITANVPLPEIVSWLRSFGGMLVVEFVHPTDPMARRLLANKRSGLFPNYNVESFEEALAERYAVIERTTLPSGTRTLYTARPR
jgi:hypothetical protein